MEDFHYIPLKESKKNLILDTDIGPDCDDVGAIALMAMLARKYSVPVSAVINCTSSKYGAPCAEALCRYAGLRVGVFAENKRNGFLDSDTYEKFNRRIAEQFGTVRDYIDAVTSYRRVLSLIPDNSAVVVAIGPFATLAQLITSTSDEFSDLNGEELFNRKVYAVITMAGKYPHGNEWNILMDPSSACVFFSHCRTPVIFSDFDIGYAVRSGFPNAKPIHTDDPFYMSYYYYLGGNDKMESLMNASYDLTAVQFAFEGESEYFGVSNAENFSIDENGYNVFSETGRKNCRRIIKRVSDECLGKYYNGILSSIAQKSPRDIITVGDA
ncbi:MAG: nucleoside hydrolase [Eubacteriales bacterium]